MFINRALLRFAEGSWKKIMGSVLFYLLLTLISSAEALLMSFLVNDLFFSVFSGEGLYFTTKHGMLIGGMIFLLLLLKVLAKKNVLVVTNAGVSIKDNVRTKMVQKLFLLGPEAVSKSRTGTLTSIFTTRVEWLMNYYTAYMPAVVSAMINAMLFVVFLSYVDIYTGVVAFLSVWIMLLIPMSFFRLMRRRGEEEWKWHAKYYSECLDGIQGMVNLKAFNADERYVKEVKHYGESYRKAVMSHLGVTIIEGTFLEFFVRIGAALTIVLLAWRSVAGYVDRSMLIVSFFAVGAAFSPMLALINAWHLGFQGVSGSYSIDEFLRRKAEHPLSNRTIPKKLSNREEMERHFKREESEGRLFREEFAHVCFKGVTFHYEGEEKNAVQEIEFEVKSGKMTALVGISGGGKSTIAGLLTGFYRPCSGTVTLNGCPLNDENVEYFHENISAVWQDNHLFAGTIYDNIRIGRWDAGEEEVVEVAKKARIHDLILSLPMKYRTGIHELGGLFSTGERQRIAIARALLKEAPILILDEATSSLDRENERYIQETLEVLKKQKAILVIAHRLQTVSMADEICFLKQGKIIARGTHDELLRESEAYRELWKGAL